MTQSDRSEETLVSAGTCSPVATLETVSPDPLVADYERAGQQVGDIVLKNYLHHLSKMEVIPPVAAVTDINRLRLFRITEMVYQRDEYATLKFASVFNAVQHLGCGLAVIVTSEGERTEFYMGVRAHSHRYTENSLAATVKNALFGQFPGIKISEDLDCGEIMGFRERIPAAFMASVSCVANSKDEDIRENKTFIQGLEKLALAMRGKKYTAIVLADGVMQETLDSVRRGYEEVYTQLSPFAKVEVTRGRNWSTTVSDAISKGVTEGSTYSATVSDSTTKTISTTNTVGESTTKQSLAGRWLKIGGEVVLGAAALATAPLTGVASIAVAGGLMAVRAVSSAYQPSTETTSTQRSVSHGQSDTHTVGRTEGTSKSTSETSTHSESNTEGSSESTQLTRQNKRLLSLLERIDGQLQRISECESLGMWASAAYFLADSQDVAQMAAGTYKALMMGEKSGLETCAVNCWDIGRDNPTAALRDYVTHLVHPMFIYHGIAGDAPVTAVSLVSSNELAIQMGLPRRSVCGLPVVEHAEFGQEAGPSDGGVGKRELCIGRIYSMGKKTTTKVRLNVDALTMHTFITGSTGSGKSNTLYLMLDRLWKNFRVHFLVVEPAKGEYKRFFGSEYGVTVYGSNPRETALLRLNPFSFPKEIHVLEHLDRLVDLFNVCWPMYAAMPAILKDAIVRAYEEAGWDLAHSVNREGAYFPNFRDVLEQIGKVVAESQYSADTKGDYSGALMTRVRSLTTGLNSLMFVNDEVTDEELFDRNVIVDLSRVGSSETKSLIMGLLVMKLNEHRMASGKINGALSHVTVLEEAHNLLRRTSAEQSNESANLTGKSVEMLANSIAEVRTYGEGFVIADQAPGLLDMAVIRNTNTKLILRLPDIGDRELVGYAAGLNKEQIEELTRLERGVAAVYQSDWVQPVLAKIEHSRLEEHPYNYTTKKPDLDTDVVRCQVLDLLFRGLGGEPPELAVQELRRGLPALALPTRSYRIIARELMSYGQQRSGMSLASEADYRAIANVVADVANVRIRVQRLVRDAGCTGDRLMAELAKLASAVWPSTTGRKRIALCRCFMLDAVDCEPAFRSRYAEWELHLRARSGK